MARHPKKRRLLLRYGLAVALVAAAGAVRMFLDPITGGGAPFVLFFGAVAAASLLAGPGPGLLATLLSVPLGARGFLVGTAYSQSQTLMQAGLFAADGLLIVYLSVTVARARRAAETSEAHQRELIELAPDPFFLADLDGRFTDVNESACRMLGYEREELIGKTIADLIPPEDLPRLAADRAELLVPGQVKRGEWRHRRKDGTLIATEVSAKILPGGRWQAFTRDISERKRLAEEQRFLAEAGVVLGASLDYEQTLSTLGHLVVRDVADWCVIDLIEDQNRPRRHKVISGNVAHAGLAAEFEQLPLDRRLPHLAGPVLETRRPYLVGRVTPEKLGSLAQNEVHLRILRDIGPQSILGLPLLVRGELRGVLVLMSTRASRSYNRQDLRMGEALAERAALAIENGRLYQMAKNATRLRDEVLGVVAHDLRNPVAAITLSATALQRRRPEGERRNLKPVDNIIRAAGRMNRLIADLLDVSLIEAGQLRVDCADVATRQLLADSIEAQRPLIASANLEMEVEVPDDLPDVWGDQHRLLQILENLVGNAIKFTPAGGCIRIGAASREGEVLFWIADTGSGISADGLPHVFDPFWQARKGTRQGAGLGLPITRGIVEAHGGRIWVESTLGRGSVFFFTIPVTPLRLPGGARASDTLH